ncbi:hypothetical protein FTV88_0018 [Heliorestis convoluta]|uniref:Uncharacterized protein n=1 Tax=Heliorestis convoluta TaxID=356322 RepID=A0A5Q2MVJ8_9FIRM|nr:hypothetical protein FTV88_0018 [Heliorestis convoluta]
MYLGQALFIPGERTSELSHRQLAAANELTNKGGFYNASTQPIP